jgi:hypothetical protein
VHRVGLIARLAQELVLVELAIRDINQIQVEFVEHVQEVNIILMDWLVLAVALAIGLLIKLLVLRVVLVV